MDFSRKQPLRSRAARAASTLLLLSAAAATLLGQARGQAVPGPHVLQILGMFPDPSASSSVLWPDGYWCIPAVQLAIDHVNNHSVLAGYRLELQTATSGCRRNPAVAAYIERVTSRGTAPPIAIVGPGCSASALPLASLLASSPAKIVQVSYGATSPSLSNVAAFPHFFRTVMPNSQLTRTMALLLRQLKWSNIATLYEDNNILRSTALSLHGWLGEADIVENGRVLHSALVTSSTIEFELQQIRESNGRIVFAFAFAGTAAEILCHAYRQDMIYPRYVWIFPEHYGAFWSAAAGDCSAEEMQVAATGTLGFTFRTVTTETKKDFVSGINLASFDEQYSIALGDFVVEYNSTVAGTLEQAPVPSYQFYRTAAYDSVWALALALNRTEQILKDVHSLSLANYSQHQNLVTDLVRQNMEAVEFQGASGYVAIHKQHFSYLPVFFDQARADADGKVVYSRIGSQVFTAEHPEGTSLQLLSDFIWKDSPPSDEFRIVAVNPGSVVTGAIVLVFATIVFLTNSASMFVNYFYRFNPALKTSSPSLNWFVFSGHYLILLGVVLYSVLMLHLNFCTVAYGTLCNLLPWTISVGYTLVIATITVKCFRIYMIFHQATKMNSGRRFKWLLKDTSLMVLILAIVAVDVILLVAWSGVGPLMRSIYKQVDVVNGIEEQILSCHLSEDNTSTGFIWAIIAWKFLLTITVMFFAWEMRSISIRDFDNAGTSFTFLLANLVLTLISIIVVFFLVSSNVASTAPVYVYVIVSAAMLLFICFSLGILLGFKQKRLLSKDAAGRYLLFSTFVTRGEQFEEHRGSDASRSTYPSYFSEHMNSMSEQRSSLEPDGKSTPPTPTSVSPPRQ